MSNENDNTEISSNHICNPGPSTAAESLNNRSTININSTTNDEEDNKNLSETKFLPNVNGTDNPEITEEGGSPAFHSASESLDGDAIETIEILETVTNIAPGSHQDVPADTQRQTTSNVASNRNNINAVAGLHTIASFPEGSNQNYPTTSTRSVTNSPPAKAHRYYRALSGQIASDTEVNITPLPFEPYVIHGPPPLAGAPPSYSAVMRIGPSDPMFRDRPIRIQPSPPFVAPIPPPSYGEVQGYHLDRPMIVASGNIETSILLDKTALN